MFRPPPRSPLIYHPQAYAFMFAALRKSQVRLGRMGDDHKNVKSHVSGVELLDGIRRLALEQYGMMARLVFRHWGVTKTDDFGRMVWEMIERGEMTKTEQDRLDDFAEVYDFEEVFDRGYEIDVSQAFPQRRR